MGTLNLAGTSPWRTFVSLPRRAGSTRTGSPTATRFSRLLAKLRVERTWRRNVLALSQRMIMTTTTTSMTTMTTTMITTTTSTEQGGTLKEGGTGELQQGQRRGVVVLEDQIKASE